jgi:hypothetical protein
VTGLDYYAYCPITWWAAYALTCYIAYRTINRKATK